MKISKITILTGILLFFSLTNLAQNEFSAKEKNEIKRYEQLIEKYKQQNNKRLQAQYLNKLAYIYWKKNKNNKALSYFEQSIALNKAINNANALYTLHNNSGMIYTDLEQDQKALDMFQESLKYAEKMKSKERSADAHKNIATKLKQLGKYDQAIDNYKKSLRLANELNDMRRIRTCYAGLAETYEKLGNTDKRIEYYNLYSMFDRKIKEIQLLREKEKTAKATAQKRAKELELKYKSLQLQTTKDSLQKAERIAREKQLKLDLLEQEQELKKQQLEIKEQKSRLRTTRIIIFSLIGVFLLILLFSILLYKQYREKKKANQMLEIQNVKLKEQKTQIEHQSQLLEESYNELEKKNQQITDSIKYASRIQEAILPSKRAIRENFPESFIYYQPRDIVSGDFYWFARHEKKLFIAAVDCTGHSVPGAFMSMIGNTLLNEIVNEKRIYDPPQILDKLNVGVINALKQQEAEGSQDDGMDVTLYCIDKENMTIEAAIASHFSYIIQNDDIKTIEGDMFSIGGFFSLRPDLNFTSHKFKIEGETWIYLFSDGYQDQFGGPDNKKFMAGRLRRMLYENHNLPMPEQRDLIDRTFDQWRGTAKQTDDVLVIGVKVN